VWDRDEIIVGPKEAVYMEEDTESGRVGEPLW
jgi:hypothetical protein